MNEIYITLQQTLMNNGHRHKANGDAYMDENNVEYAIGSYKKMLRNYEAANRTNMLMECGLDKTLLDDNKLAEQIAEAILKGCTTSSLL
jgi:hypothetical protein